MALNQLLLPNPKEWSQLKANTLTLSGGLVLPNSGGSPSPLNYYEELNHTTLIAGPWTTQPSMLIRLTRIGRTVIATSFAQVTGTFSAPGLATLVTPIPARFKPFGNVVRMYNHVVNNGLGVQSHADIDPSGQITFGVDGGNFTAGSCIILVFSFVWTI